MIIIKNGVVALWIGKFVGNWSGITGKRSSLNRSFEKKKRWEKSLKKSWFILVVQDFSSPFAFIVHGYQLSRKQLEGYLNPSRYCS